MASAGQARATFAILALTDQAVGHDPRRRPPSVNQAVQALQIPNVIALGAGRSRVSRRSDREGSIADPGFWNDLCEIRGYRSKKIFSNRLYRVLMEYHPLNLHGA